jgi:polyisoprenoid-binding protein YceI
MNILSRLLIIALLVAAPVGAAAATWQIDPDHASVEFKVRHLMVAWVKGSFTTVTGNVEIDDADLTTAQARVSIDAASINTNNRKRDEHLRSEDFLAVADFPTITFVSSRVIAADGIPRQLIGALTIRGTTREVTLDIDELTLPIKDPWGNTRRGVTATTEINRRDFGLTWNKALEAGGVVVGDEVKIALDVELIRQ